MTRLLQSWQKGDQEALNRLMPLVYAELRELARSHLAREGRGHTLAPTTLVHEAYLRLVRGNPHGFDNRTQFYALAGQLMRRFLVDHARSKKAAKRGGGQPRLTLNDADAAWRPAFDELLAVDEALRRLEEVDPRKSRVIELRYFAGLSVEETARLLGVSAPTVILDTRLARAWLYDHLRGGGGDT